jgi:adenylate cyclase
VNLSAYLPQDRRRALAQGDSLPDRITGAALFADISGFTALTDALRKLFGPRRGAEELTSHLNAVYAALIAEVEGYGGSVIGFAGDAITCWFDDERPTTNDQRPTAAARAVGCGLALQAAIRPFQTLPLAGDNVVTLRLKVAVATGPARRFVVGDPAYQYLDTLAGATIARMAAAERLAQRGELLADQTTIAALGTAVTVNEWRQEADSAERFGVIAACAISTPPPVAAVAQPLDPERLRPWLLRPVYDREQTEYAAFLTEFRPCAVLFIRFAGIAYDSDAAQAQLDAFIRQTQAVAARYEGALLNLTIGDKGSYAYLNFGALSAHEDDARRAVKTAVELAQLPQTLDFLAPLQMGVSQGLMRVGAYGGPTRRVYSAIGDDVNLAARLMQAAVPGEILTSDPIYKAVSDDFVFERRPSIPVKGKADPLPIYAVLERRRQSLRLQEPNYNLPMVGRRREMTRLNEILTAAKAGQGQTAAIVADAGMGKSRLAAEAIRAARQRGFVGYGGACQSDGVNVPYLVWKPIWSGLFDLNPADSPAQQTQTLTRRVAALAPERLAALPLLAPLLDLPLADNEFTRSLEPKIRQSARHALLEDCLKAAVRAQPTLIVIEDLHWIDAISHNLLHELIQALSNYPVCFLLAYRPSATAVTETWPNFHKIELNELNAAEAEQLIQAKLNRWAAPPRENSSAALAAALLARTQGNPLYLEELLNLLRDRGLIRADLSGLSDLDLPDSLHAMIWSRIDQLTEREKTTLRVASVIGRLFSALWLTGYYPELGPLAEIKPVLDQLDALDITPLDAPAPEWTYLFKHLVTHEATYESLPFATRARLHERLAHFLEAAYADAPPLEALAFHYGRSDNAAKKRDYLRRAGEAAQKNFANEAALTYYGQLLPLLDEAEKLAVLLQRGRILELIGRYDEAEADYRAALEISDRLAQPAGARFALAQLCRQRGDYQAALSWLNEAQSRRAAREDSAGLAEALIEMGMVLYRLGDYDKVREPLHQGLALTRAADDKAGAALALNNLGNVAYSQGDYDAARALYEESLTLRRELGDKYGVANSLGNLGNVVAAQGDYAAAHALHEESLTLRREMGDKYGIGVTLSHLGLMVKRQGEYAQSRQLFAEALALRREIGDKLGVSVSLNNLADVAYNQGEYETALVLYEDSLALKREMGDKRGMSLALHNLGAVQFEMGHYQAARTFYEESLALKREMGNRWGIANSLNNMGEVAWAEGDLAATERLFTESLTMRQEMGDKAGVSRSLLNLGRVAIERGDYPQASEMLRESLTMRLELGDKRGVAQSQMGLGELAAAQGEMARAVKLLAAAETLLNSFDAVMTPANRRRVDRALAAAREGLSEAEFQAAWQAGAAMSPEEAAAYALTSQFVLTSQFAQSRSTLHIEKRGMKSFVYSTLKFNCVE